MDQIKTNQPSLLIEAERVLSRVWLDFRFEAAGERDCDKVFIMIKLG